MILPIEQFINDAAKLGIESEQIRSCIYKKAKSELKNRYRKMCRHLGDMMEVAPIEDLKAIVAEMEKGGQQ